jgi:hypothetical protein
MKSFLIYTFVLILLNSSFTNQHPIPDEVEEYINAFFTTLNGADFEVDDQCFGQEQVNQIKDLIKAIKKRNFIKIVKNLKDNKNFIADHCPIKEVQDYFDQLNKAIKEGYYKENFMNNLKPIGEILFSLAKKHFRVSAYEAGVATAKIAKIVFYKKTE